MIIKTKKIQMIGVSNCIAVIGSTINVKKKIQNFKFLQNVAHFSIIKLCNFTGSKNGLNVNDQRCNHTDSDDKRVEESSENHDSESISQLSTNLSDMTNLVSLKN